MTSKELIDKYPPLAAPADNLYQHEHLIMLAYHAGRWDGIDTALKINKKESENVQA